MPEVVVHPAPPVSSSPALAPAAVAIPVLPNAPGDHVDPSSRLKPPPISTSLHNTPRMPAELAAHPAGGRRTEGPNGGYMARSGVPTMSARQLLQGQVVGQQHDDEIMHRLMQGTTPTATANKRGAPASGDVMQRRDDAAMDKLLVASLADAGGEPGTFQYRHASFLEPRAEDVAHTQRHSVSGLARARPVMPSNLARSHDGGVSMSSHPRGARRPRAAPKRTRVATGKSIRAPERDILEERAAPDVKGENMELRKREEEMRLQLQQMKVGLQRERELLKGRVKHDAEGAKTRTLDQPNKTTEVEQLQKALAASGLQRVRRQAATSPGLQRGRRPHSQPQQPRIAGRLRARFAAARDADPTSKRSAPSDDFHFTAAHSPEQLSRMSAAQVPAAYAPQTHLQPASSFGPPSSHQGYAAASAVHIPVAASRPAAASMPVPMSPPRYELPLPLQPSSASAIPAPSPPQPCRPTVSSLAAASSPLVVPTRAPEAATGGADVDQQMRMEVEELRRLKKELSAQLDDLLVNRIKDAHGESSLKQKVKVKNKTLDDKIWILESTLQQQRDKAQTANELLQKDRHRLQSDLAVAERDVYHAETVASVVAPELQPLHDRLQAARHYNKDATLQIKALTKDAFSAADQRVISEQRMKDREEDLQRKQAECESIDRERQLVDEEHATIGHEAAAMEQQCRDGMIQGERLSIRLEEKGKTVRNMQDQLKNTLDGLDAEDRKVLEFSLNFMREREDAIAAAEAARRGLPPSLSARITVEGAMAGVGQGIASSVADLSHVVDSLRAEKDELAQELRAVQGICQRELEINKDVKALHNLDVRELAEQIRATCADTDRCKRLAHDRDKRIVELRHSLSKRQQKATPSAIVVGAVERAPDVISEAGFSDLSDVEGASNCLDIYLLGGRVEERALLELPQQAGNGEVPPEKALLTMISVDFMTCEAGFSEESSGLRPRYDSLVSFGPFDVDDPVIEHFARGAVRFELQAFNAAAQTSYTLGRASLPLTVLLDCTPTDPNPIVAGTLCFASASDDLLQIASIHYKARWRKSIVQALEAYSSRKATTVPAVVAAQTADSGARAFGALMDATKTLLVHIAGVSGLVPSRQGSAPEFLRPYVTYEVPGHREHFTKTLTGASCRFEDISKMVVRVDAQFCKWVEEGGGLHFLVFDGAAPAASAAATEEQLGLIGEAWVPVSSLLQNQHAQVCGNYQLRRGGAAASTLPSVGFIDVNIRWHDEASAVMAPGLGGPSVVAADHRGSVLLTDQQYQIVWNRVARRLLMLQVSATQWFYKHDADKDGRWSREEARSALSSMPIGLSSFEVDHVLDRLDVRRQQFISLDDVTAALLEGTKAAPLEQWARDIYRSISEALSRQRMSAEQAFDMVAVAKRAQKHEFFALATSLDLGLRPEQLEWLWKLSDVNSDGLLDYAEFAARLREAATIGTTAFTLPRPTDRERGLAGAEAPERRVVEGGGSIMPEAWFDLCLMRIMLRCRELGWHNAEKVVEQIPTREDKTITRAELTQFCLRSTCRLSDWEVDNMFMRLDPDARTKIEPRAIRTALLLVDVSDSHAHSAAQRVLECFGQLRLGLMKELQVANGGVAPASSTQRDYAAQLRIVLRGVAAQKEPLIVNRSDLLAAALQLSKDIGEARLQELWYFVGKMRDNSLDIDNFAARIFTSPLPGEADAITDDYYAILLGRLHRALQRLGLGSAEAAFRRFAKPSASGHLCLTPAELEGGLQQTVDNLSAQERRLLANKIDANRDGQISLPELQTAMAHAHVAALSSWADNVCVRVSALLRHQGRTSDELFEALAKGGGAVQWPSFRQLFSQIDPSLSDLQLQRLWQNFDKNGDGSVSRLEFKRALAAASDGEAAALPGGDLQDVSVRVATLLRREGKLPDQLFDALAHGTSVVQWSDFRNFFVQIEQGLDEEQLQRLWRTYDTDGDGGISRDEFRRALAAADAAEVATHPTGDLQEVSARVADILRRERRTPDQLFDALSKASPVVRWDDFKAFFVAVEPSLTEAKLQCLWRTFDKDGNGGVDRSEFKRALAVAEAVRAAAVAPSDVLLSRIGRALGRSMSLLSVKDALSFYDTGAEGSVNIEQWLTACRGLQLPMSPAESVALHKTLTRGPGERLQLSHVEREIARVTGLATGLPEERWARDLVTSRARLALDQGATPLHEVLAASARQAGQTEAVDETSVRAALERHAALPEEQWARLRLLLERRPEDGMVLWKPFLQWVCAETEQPPVTMASFAGGPSSAALPSTIVADPGSPSPPLPVAVPRPVHPSSPPPPPAAAAKDKPDAAATAAPASAPASGAPPAARVEQPGVVTQPERGKDEQNKVAKDDVKGPTAAEAAASGGRGSRPSGAPPQTQPPRATQDAAATSAMAALVDGILGAVAEVVAMRGGDAAEQLNNFADPANSGKLSRAAFGKAMLWYIPSLKNEVTDALWSRVLRGSSGPSSVDSIEIEAVAKLFEPQRRGSSGSPDAAIAEPQETKADGGALWVALRKVRAAFHAQGWRLPTAFQQLAHAEPADGGVRRLPAAALSQGLLALFHMKLSDQEFQALYTAMAPQPHLGATQAEFVAAFGSVAEGFDQYAIELLQKVGRALVERHRGSVSDAFQMLDLAGDGEVGKGPLCAVVTRFGDTTLLDAQCDRLWELVCESMTPPAAAMNFEGFKKLLCSDLRGDRAGSPAPPQTRSLPSFEESCRHLDRLDCIAQLREALHRRNPDGWLPVELVASAVREVAPQLSKAEVDQICRLAPRKGGPLRGENLRDYSELLTRLEQGRRYQDWHPLEVRERAPAADVCRYIQQQLHAYGCSSVAQLLVSGVDPAARDAAGFAPMAAYTVFEQLVRFLKTEQDRRVVEMLLLKLGRPVPPDRIDLAEFCQRFDQLALGQVATSYGDTPSSPAGAALGGAADTGTAAGAFGPKSEGCGAVSCTFSNGKWPLDLNAQQTSYVLDRLRREGQAGSVSFHSLVRILMEANVQISRRQEQALRSWLCPAGKDPRWPLLFAFAVVVEKITIVADKATRRKYGEGLQVQISFCGRSVTFEVMPWRLGLVSSCAPGEPKTMALQPQWYALFPLDGPEGLKPESIAQAFARPRPQPSHLVRVAVFGLQSAHASASRVGPGAIRVQLAETELCIADEVPSADLKVGMPGSERGMPWRPHSAAQVGPRGSTPRIIVSLSTRQAARLHQIHQSQAGGPAMSPSATTLLAPSPAAAVLTGPSPAASAPSSAQQIGLPPPVAGGVLAQAAASMPPTGVPHGTGHSTLQPADAHPTNSPGIGRMAP